MTTTTPVDPELEEFSRQIEWRQINWRNEESFRHARQILKPYGELDRILTWCRTELTEDWRWQMVEMAAPDRLGRYIFYFDGERDYLAFVMCWA